jgi:methionine-gamma-lyase
VACVHYPRIGGAMIAFEVHGDPHEVIAAVRLITPAVSLGSVDSLIQHPASISHRVVEAEDRRGAGVSDRLLRLSVGLEDVEDLWSDLDGALAPLPRGAGNCATSHSAPALADETAAVTALRPSRTP